MREKREAYVGLAKDVYCKLKAGLSAGVERLLQCAAIPSAYAVRRAVPQSNVVLAAFV